MRVRAVASALLLVTALTVASACQKNTDPTTVDYWAAQLKDKRSRGDALKELGKLGKKEAVPLIVPWLEQEGPWQADAAFSLAQLGDAAVVPKLLASIDYTAGSKDNNDPAVQNKVRTNLSIVRALVLLKAKEGIPALGKLLQSPESKTREVAIRALGQMHATGAVQQLLDVAQNDRQQVLAQAAVRALGEIGDPKAAPTLVLFLYNDALYDEARFSLMQIGQPAVPALLRALNRQDPALEALRQPNTTPLPDGTIETRAAFVLGALHASDAESAVVAAFERLAKRAVGKPQDMPPSLTAAVVELAYALGSLGGPAALKALVPLSKSPNDTLRIAAAEALTTLGPEAQVVAALSAAAAAPGSVDARGAAIVALGRVAPGETLTALDALPKKTATKEVPAATLQDMVDATRPRLVAAQACQSTLACWKGKLKDADATVRERAAYELGWRGAKDAAGELQKAAEDDDALVRMASIIAMQRLNVGDAVALQKIYDAWNAKVEYAAVNQELRWLIARRQNGGK